MAELNRYVSPTSALLESGSSHEKMSQSKQRSVQGELSPIVADLLTRSTQVISDSSMSKFDQDPSCSVKDGIDESLATDISEKRIKESIDQIQSLESILRESELNTDNAQNNTDLSDEIIKDIIVSTISTVAISTITVSSAGVAIPLIPIIMSSMVASGSKGILKLSDHYLPSSLAYLTRKTVSVASLGWLGYQCVSTGFLGACPMLGASILGYLGRSQTVESAVKKRLGTGISKDLADILIRSLSIVSGYRLGQGAANLGQSVAKSLTPLLFPPPLPMCEMQSFMIPEMQSSMQEAIIIAAQSNHSLEERHASLEKFGIKYRHIDKDLDHSVIDAELGVADKIGEGHFSKVYLSTKYPDYIIKKCMPDVQVNRDEIPSILACQNAVALTLNQAPRVHQLLESPEMLWMLVDKVEYPTIEQWLSTSKPSFRDRVMVSIHLIETISRLRQMKIRHGDIHSRNVMVKEGGNNVFLVDFDESRFYPDQFQEHISHGHRFDARRTGDLILKIFNVHTFHHSENFLGFLMDEFPKELKDEEKPSASLPDIALKFAQYHYVKEDFWDYVSGPLKSSLEAFIKEFSECRFPT